MLREDDFEAALLSNVPLFSTTSLHAILPETTPRGLEMWARTDNAQLIELGCPLELLTLFDLPKLIMRRNIRCVFENVLLELFSSLPLPPKLIRSPGLSLCFLIQYNLIFSRCKATQWSMP